MAAQRRVSPTFKLAFFTLLGLTLLFFGAAVVFSILVPNPTESQESTDAALLKAGTYSLTALGALFAGKVA
jgi:uncharacterized protein YpmS